MTHRLLHCSISAPVAQSPRLELLSSIRKAFSHTLGSCSSFSSSPSSSPTSTAVRSPLPRPHSSAEIRHPPFANSASFSPLFFWTYTPFLIFSGLARRSFLRTKKFSPSEFAVWSAIHFWSLAFSRGFAALLLCRLFSSASENPAAYPCFAGIVVQHFPARHRGLRQLLHQHRRLAPVPAFGLLLGGALMQRYGWRPVFHSRLGAAGFFSGFRFWARANAAFFTRGLYPATENENRARPPPLRTFSRHRSALGHVSSAISAANYFLYFLLTWLPLLSRSRPPVFSRAYGGKSARSPISSWPTVGLASGFASDRLN